MLGQRPLDRITPTHVTLGMGVFSALVISLCTVSAYTTSTPLPGPGPAPTTPEKAALRTYRYLPTFFASLAEEDAKKVGLRKFSVKSLREGQQYRTEFTGRQKLKPGGTLETTTLLLKAMERKLWIGEEGQQYRMEHYILRITNRSDKHVAYRVDTEALGRCQQKAALSYNGLSLRPSETVERTECTLGKATSIFVRSVEVLEISPLGYYYVQRIEPRALLFATRTAEGHDAGKLSSCRIMPWQLLKEGLPTGSLRWYDVVDFYSRHNCDEYTFFAGYRWSSDGLRSLPARPPGES